MHHKEMCTGQAQRRPTKAATDFDSLDPWRPEWVSCYLVMISITRGTTWLGYEPYVWKSLCQKGSYFGTTCMYENAMGVILQKKKDASIATRTTAPGRHT